MAADSVQVINHHQANLHVKERVNKAGNVTGYRSNITIEVHSEPIAVCLDETAVARFIAEAYAKQVREQTKQIGETVKPSTAKARRVVEKAFAAGKGYALKQYAGGRIGVTPPNNTNQSFNHSGRLADSIVAQLRGKDDSAEWVINYAANRWDIKHWGDAAKMEAAFRKWVSLVPVMSHPAEDLGIQRAAKDMMGEVLKKQKMDAGHDAAKRSGELVVKVIQAAARLA